MARVRAAILAAGRGFRMGGDVPKTLIPIDGHEPLLYYLILGLKVAGVTDVLIVTGHRHHDVEDHASKYGEGLEVAFVGNARYASWGNFHSVRLAIDQSPGVDLLVVNSDVVVHPNVFHRVLTAPGDLVLATEQKYRLDEEDMRVWLKGDRVRGIGKELPRAHSHGEYAGVSLLRPDAARAYSEIASDLEWRGETHGYYEDVFALMLGHVDARAASVAAGEYAEVDEPNDMAGAAAVIERHAAAWES
jgi:choline kinase